MTMVRFAIDHLFPPDPGSLRLLAALRATLSGVLTLLLVLLLGMFVVAPITDRILGFAIGLFLAATVRDSDVGQKLVTIALGALGAFTSTMLAAFLLEQPFAAAAVVPVLMFVVVYSSIRGPRYASIGTVTLIGYIIGLVTRQLPETLPTRLLVICLAAGVAALIHGLLLPERPQAELNRLRRAVRAGIANVLDQSPSQLPPARGPLPCAPSCSARSPALARQQCWLRRALHDWPDNCPVRAFPGCSF